MWLVNSAQVKCALSVINNINLPDRQRVVLEQYGKFYVNSDCSSAIYQAFGKPKFRNKSLRICSVCALKTYHLVSVTFSAENYMR